MEQVSMFDLKGLEKFKPIKSTDWKWNMATDYPPKNELTVFSCFACGGGSTMGYKLCGCDVIGCCEIDPKMNDVYIKNHKPKYNFLMDIRDFNKKEDLPKELYDLDILDGSPPCTTFSLAGDREESWGKKKKFREGQVEQTLDDLSFVFIDTVAKLKPKVVIMENVEGLLLGNAWKYVQQIYKKFKDIGYKVKHWLLKGERMGVPQTRHRVFFVATRLDFDLDKIDMVFNYEPILYGDIKTSEEKIANGKMAKAIKQIKKNESIADCMKRIYGVNSGITHRMAYNDKVYPSQTAGHDDIWTENANHPSFLDVIHCATFPEDYNFNKTKEEYICGMSVPPIMLKRVVTRLIESGIFNYKLTKQYQNT
jgi:DNA (cytosine-5)-methyltransferase 1